MDTYELELYGSDAVSRSIAIIFHDSCRIDRHVGFDHMRYYLTVTNVGATDKVEINIIRGIGDLTSLICIIIFFHVTLLLQLAFVVFTNWLVVQDLDASIR